MNSNQKNNLSFEDWEFVLESYEKLEPLSELERARLVSKLEIEKPEIALEVKALLNSSSQLNSFMEEPSALLQEYFSKNVGIEIKVGDKFEGYEILDVLGKGGFATVYLAKDLSLGREVALKVSEQSGSEGSTLAQFDHENIVRVYDQKLVESEGAHWISMQYIPGVTLDSLVTTYQKTSLNGLKILEEIDSKITRQTYFNPNAFSERYEFSLLSSEATILWMGIRLADALFCAHEKGLLHLDIKPSNIILNQMGRPYLMDFNISLSVGTKSKGDMARFGGTWDYMSPEQKAVFEVEDKLNALKKIDVRSDIFSLGMVLKELWAVIPGAEKGRAWKVFEKASSDSPKNRYQTALRFKMALETVLKIKEIENDLPKPDRFLRVANEYPLTVLTLVGALPQVAASLVCINYNQQQIVSELTVRQQSFFKNLNFGYTPLVFLTGALLWFYFCFRYTQLTKHSKIERSLRLHALSFSKLGMWTNSVSWGGSYIVYCGALHFWVGPLSLINFFHFSVSFILSWLISFSYTYLLHQYVILNSLYFSHWEDGCDIKKTAKKELATVVKWIRFSFLSVILIPNLAAAVFIFASATPVHAESMISFRALSGLMIAFGIMGLIFAFIVSQKIVKLVNAYTKT